MSNFFDTVRNLQEGTEDLKHMSDKAHSASVDAHHQDSAAAHHKAFQAHLDTSKAYNGKASLTRKITGRNEHEKMGLHHWHMATYHLDRADKLKHGSVAAPQHGW